jgi:hypothetical protein
MLILHLFCTRHQANLKKLGKGLRLVPFHIYLFAAFRRGCVTAARLPRLPGCKFATAAHRPQQRHAEAVKQDNKADATNFVQSRLLLSSLLAVALHLSSLITPFGLSPCQASRVPVPGEWHFICTVFPSSLSRLHRWHAHCHACAGVRLQVFAGDWTREEQSKYKKRLFIASDLRGPSPYLFFF